MISLVSNWQFLLRTPLGLDGSNGSSGSVLIAGGLFLLMRDIMSRSSIIKGLPIFSSNQGLEAEYFRVSLANDDVAKTSHTRLFGDPINTPNITTDFSEALVELITDVFPSVEKNYAHMVALHNMMLEKMPEDEYIWYFSTPPIFKSSTYIPIAEYDMANPKGQARRLYREKLAQKYGTFMQSWSGIHYNLSFGEDLLRSMWESSGGLSSFEDFSDEIYFKTARNFLRYYWLLLILTGSTPSTTPEYSKFIKQRINYDRDTSGGVALRTSEYGYLYSHRNKATPSFNGLHSYISSVEMLKTAYSDVFRNEYIIQNENEIYLPIRIKSPAPTSSTLSNLAQRGVSYLEVRCLDYNPYTPFGVDKDAMYLIHSLLIWCAFGSDELMSSDEFSYIMKTSNELALSARSVETSKYECRLVDIQDKGVEILSKIVAFLGDSSSAEKDKYIGVLNAYIERLKKYDLLSQRVENDFPMREFSKAIAHSREKTALNRK